MSDEKKKNAFHIRDFKDAGTEQSFAAGAVSQISEGAFINYQAAGLVREATAEEVRAAKNEGKPAT